MTDQWDIMWRLFHAALELPVEQRRKYLESECTDDPALLAEIESLLASHDATENLPDPESALSDSGLDTELAEAAAGQVIGEYRILREVGQGGMGVVYEVVQESLDRHVALKLIRLGMDTREVIARFKAERQALAMMKHPNIAQVIDAGATPAGRPYFVMELIDGIPITRYCDEQRLDMAARLELFLAVCDGVQHAHQKGVIHRDLKPTNVLVSLQNGKPVPKIIDFGVAKATDQMSFARTLFTQAGLFVGTPEYMSPEQAGGTEFDVDTRTDVYSLGILLYELLVGALPFEPAELRRLGYEEICRRIREDEPARPSLRLSTLAAHADELARRRRTDSGSLVRLLRGDLDWITMRALDKDPDRRYSSPLELAADLRRHIGNEPVEARAPSVTYLVRKFARRHKLAVATGALVALSLLVGAGTATFGLLRAQEAERLAIAEARTADEVADFLTGLFRVSEPSAAAANSITAREVLDKGVARIRDELDSEPAVQSRLMQEMAEVYAQLGLVEEARVLFEETHELRRSLPEVSALEMSKTIAGLAGVLAQAAEYEASIEQYREALAAAGPSALEQSPEWVATMYRSLGGVYQSVAMYDESLESLSTARSILEASGHADTIEYGRVLRNIGISQWSLNNFEAAREAYTTALDMFDATLEPGHPDISYVVNSLAILNYNLGDFESARPMFERGLADLERTLGSEHRNTASMMNNLGLLLLEMGFLDEARSKIVEALRIRETVLGAEHEEFATSLCNLGRLLYAEGAIEDAAQNLRRCISIRQVTLGENHPYVAMALKLLAPVLEDLGDGEGAGAALRRAREIEAAQATKKAQNP